MDYIVCKECGKETVEKDFFGNKINKCSWCGEQPNFIWSTIDTNNKDIQVIELFDCISCKNLIGTVDDFEDISFQVIPKKNEILGHGIEYSNTLDSINNNFKNGSLGMFKTKCPSCDVTCMFSYSKKDNEIFSKTVIKYRKNITIKELELLKEKRNII
jgi:hypothetical protein